jgi:putative Mg2+ transporter-C (MgtC) family protein
MSWFETSGLGSTTLPVIEIAMRFLLATLFGAVVGFERELRGHSAGLRTHMLTALAACMFTVLTFEIFHQVRQLDNSPNVDPLRLIEAVTTGVSFLAAGTIIHGSGKVQGLTTGAGIWLAGAVGVACGAGFYAIALMGTVLALIIVVLLRRVERHVLDTKKSRSRSARDDEN